MTKIAVLDDWQGIARTSADWSPLTAIAEVVFFAQPFSDEDDAARQLADFEILLTMRERTPFPASLINRLPALRMVGITGSRNASLDLAACAARGIVVCNTQDTSARASTAELALGLLLAAARSIPAADANIRAGGFQRGLPTGISLAGKTIGIVGLGRLGSTMARYCRALDMNILAWSQNLTAQSLANQSLTSDVSHAAATHSAAAHAGDATLGSFVSVVSKDELFSRSDAISIHLVLSPRTRGLVAASDIARMKPGAILINTSRGPIVDEAALIAALNERRILAALDVFDREPLPENHPLRRAPNCVLTPHLGYAVEETWTEFYPQSLENALAFLTGHPIRVIP
jgi:phosphoglycerate dehydrogenase-like enzyme